MGKSLTHKIAKTPNSKGVSKENGSKDRLKLLQKPKKTSGSIQKSKKETDQRKNDLDELKQLLNLEAPKINLNMFNSLSLDQVEQKQKKKKLSTK